MTMKKRIALILALVLCLSLTAFFGGGGYASAEETAWDQFSMREVERGEDDTEYYETLLEAERYNFKIIRNLSTVYEEETWKAYCTKTETALKTVKTGSIGDKQKEKLDKMVEMRHALVEVKPVEEAVWMLWNDSMPTTTEKLEFKTSSYDNKNSKPYLLLYLLENQENVKGNLIVVAGGGYSSRANSTEGYPIAEAFNSLGYNCYVLQRRVSPYGAIDIWMDMARAVRLVRYQVEKLGLGGADCVAATGFSGGSATVLGAIAYDYGDIQPTVNDPAYIPDEVDAVSADMDAALCIYGPNYKPSHDGFQGLVTENENLPAIFLAVGLLDTTGAVEDNLTLAQSVMDRTLVEYHAFANTPHGFGVGKDGTNSLYWVLMADCFMQQAVAAKTSH